MKNIVLLNLTRFGDQLQSQAAVNALAGEDCAPDGGKNGICLVCLPNFASGAVFLRGLDRIFPLPGNIFLHRLNKVWADALAALWEWREEIRREFRPDLVCNLTPSVAGRLLGRFLAGDAPVRGFGLDESGFGVTSPWAAFFQGASRKRSVSPFNLVDVFRAVAGQSSGRAGDSLLLPPAEDGKAEELLRGTGARGWVGFQLGASEDRRRWPVEYFAALGRELWREQALLPLLLGNAAERELAGRYAACSPGPHLDLTGRTTLEGLASILRRCRLLISNDTGTLHLAAGLGCPVLGIFLATAQCWDTGPYQENSCSIEPGLACHPCSFGADCPHGLRCRHAVPPSLLLKLCRGFLEEGTWPETASFLCVWPENRGGHVFDPFPERPRVWKASADEFSFMDLHSLSGHEGEARTLWFREQRGFLRQFLDRDCSLAFSYVPPESPFVFPFPEKEKLAGELAGLRAQLGQLLELGAMLRQKPIARLRERFIAALHRTSAAFEDSAYLLSLGLLWRVELEEEGERLEDALQRIEQYFSLISLLFQRVTA
ncbi:MAG: glycosyltransferase family 9 protein [Deltaproteobacteria bacterium]|nr:glycosyltransferase family 9 protein [Deltaproteobacteria bacterium]